MQDYRVYPLDATGRIIGANWIAASDDEQAMKQVREEASPYDCEIWDGPRRVGKVAHVGRNAA